MYRGFQRSVGTGPGYRLDHLLMMSFDPGLIRYSQADTQRFYKDLSERARAVAGVKAVTLVSWTPMATDSQSATTVLPEGFQFPEGKQNATNLAAFIDESYFDVMKVPIVSGRAILVTDDADAPRVAVVNEQFAAHYWPGQRAIGKRFRLDDSNGPWVQIVGIAKNSKYIFLLEPPMDFVYLPYRQRTERRLTLVTESFGDPAALTQPLREVVHGLDPNQPIFNVRTMEEFYRMRTINTFNIVIGLIGAMGIMGLVLSIVGLYGLVAYGVSRRTREIGIRMAIGAHQSSVLGMILRDGMVLAVVGLALGILGSIGAERALAALFPTGPSRRGLDVVALTLVAAAVLTATLIASYLPARRAAAIAPTDALRVE
jgi:predicted permease